MAGVSVCVTGAGGYIASWLVKLLLSRGYTVHGTVRDLSDMKTGHLKRLQNAAENLRLFKADLLDYDMMAAAIAGCQGVFHLQMLAPAVTGTTNVLKAASAAKVQRVVVVSSIVAVEINPKGWPEGKVRDENCWSDTEFCRKIKSWYPVAKVIAEEAALEYGRQTGLDVVTLNPGLVFGPQLQPMVNASSQFLIYLLKVRSLHGIFDPSTDTGGPDRVRDKLWHIVDVRDVADALLLIYESPEASGRHICAPHVISVRDLLNLLKSKYPDYTCLTKGPADQMRNKLWHIDDVCDVADALLLLYEVQASGRHICAPHFISAYELLPLLKNMYPDYPCIAE
ncbi:hypothetical protein PR202_gb22215 [Eleusine coracana subsp. coracana]|uniref:NAD-dependent epimerase/dehydratase domain-containing protein n=1 Tax=Eleusine coracana subsp. coracana TaxID=191504 RepID=A0AAV5FF43_ELECO|nr:hypothetical protein PR202_gb22215 [Eleusine coracana subsp. coracana]